MPKKQENNINTIIQNKKAFLIVLVLAVFLSWCISLEQKKTAIDMENVDFSTLKSGDTVVLDMAQLESKDDENWETYLAYYKYWQTALIIACWEWEIDLVKSLLRTNLSDINKKDTKGRTPLIMASRKWYEDIVRLLIENWANIDDQTNDWATSLMRAITEWHIWVIKTLLEKWANLEKSDKLWRTALILSSYEWNVDIVKLLVDNWADCLVKNVDWETIFDLVGSNERVSEILKKCKKPKKTLLKR